MMSSSFVLGPGDHVSNRSNDGRRTILQVECLVPSCFSCGGFKAGATTPPAIDEYELSTTPCGTAFSEQGQIEEPHQSNVHKLDGMSSSRMSLEDVWQTMQTVQLALAEIRKDVSSLQTVQVRSTNYLKFLTDSVNALGASTENQQQTLGKQQMAVRVQHEKLKTNIESFEANMTSKLAELQKIIFHEVNSPLPRSETSTAVTGNSPRPGIETSTAVPERLQSLEEIMLVMKTKAIDLGRASWFLPKEYQTTQQGAYNASADKRDTNKQGAADFPGSVGTCVQSPNQLHDGKLRMQASI